jgi:hypothetical protein
MVRERGYFNPDQWWTSLESRDRVIGEYTKLGILTNLLGKVLDKNKIITDGNDSVSRYTIKFFFGRNYIPEPC